MQAFRRFIDSEAPVDHHPVSMVYYDYLKAMMSNFLSEEHSYLLPGQMVPGHPLLSYVDPPVALPYLLLDSHSTQGLEKLVSGYSGLFPTYAETMDRLVAFALLVAST